MIERDDPANDRSRDHVPRESPIRGVVITTSILVEGSLPAPPPHNERRLAIDAAQRCRCFDHHAEDHSAIVVGQFDQACLGDEPAELD